MKRLLICMLCALLCACLLPGLVSIQASAESEDDIIARGWFGEDIRWFFHSDGELEISGTGEMKYESNQANIPWAGYRDQILKVTVKSGVTNIGRLAFYGCEKLSSVSIPDTVTVIREMSFSGCLSLTEITIPDSVTEIWYNVFADCTSLEKVILPSNLEELDDKAFFNCTSLKHIKLPASLKTCGYNDGVFVGCTGLTTAGPAGGDYSIEFGWTEEIPGYAFRDTQSLKSVHFPAGLKRIGRFAFFNCDVLTEADIPEGVTEIGDQAFSDCDSLSSVRVPASVTTMGSGVFCYSDELTSAGPIGGNDPYQFGWTESIPAYAFDGCRKLTGVKLPDSIKSIGNDAFRSCEAITDMKPGEFLTTLGERSFSNCSALKGITIPASLKTVGEDTFSGCSALTEVRISDLDAWCAITYGGNPGFHYSHALLLNGKEVTKLSFPAGSTEIRNYCFSYCSSLTELTVPYGVTRIGDRAFAQCSSLRTVSIPTGLKEICTAAFVACNALEDVYYRGTPDQLEKDQILIYPNNKAFQDATLHCVPDLVETPELTGKNNSKGKPVLSWKAADGASEYQIWCGTSKNGSYKLLKTTSSLKYTHSGAEIGKKYYYKIRGVSAYGSEGDYSQTVSIACKPLAPAVKGKLSSKGKPVLNWKAVTGATKYKIYYATSKNGKYKLLTTTKALKYTHSKAKAGKTYFYKVCAVTKKGVTSAYSSIVKLKVKK